jgi:SAM-dependent methyltransferase
MKYTSIDDIVTDIKQNPVESSGDIYHPIPFSEFDGLTTSSSSEAVYKKWSFIKNKLNDIYPQGISGKQILDVGANAGFYTFSLAKEEATVMSFEPHPRYAEIGGVIAREKALNVDWHSGSFDPSLLNSKQFDVALLLSVFQWMASGGENIAKASEELMAISKHCDYLFFELGFNRGKSCLQTTKINHYAHLLKMLKQNTTYKHFQLIGKTKLWGQGKRFLILCSNDSRFQDQGIRKILGTIGI